jgi:hypothetical protein
MRCKWTNEELIEAADLTRTGVSVAELARRKGVPPASLYRLLRRRSLGFSLGARWKPNLNMPTDPATIGYLAGLIDGEGSIKGSHGDEPGKVKHWNITIGMTHEGIMRWLHSLGGTFHINKRDMRTNRQQVYTWQVARTMDVLALLKATRPHLIVKAEIADRVIAELTERIR